MIDQAIPFFEANVKAHQPLLELESSSEAGDRLQAINSLRKLKALSSGWVLCLDSSKKIHLDAPQTRTPQGPESTSFAQGLGAQGAAETTIASMRCQ